MTVLFIMRGGCKDLLTFQDIIKLSVFDGLISTSQVSARFEIVHKSEFKTVAAC